MAQDLKKLAKQAEAMVAAGNLDQAIAVYHQMLDSQPDSADIHHILSLAYLENGQHTEALDAIRRAVELQPQSSRFRRSLADQLLRNTDFAQAIDAYRTALNLSPDDADILLNLGNALQLSGDAAAALECYHRVLSKAPGHHQAMNNIGKTLYDQGDLKSALEWYARSLNASPDYAEAHFNRAVARLAGGDFLQGWKAYEWRFKRREARTVYPHRLASPRWDGGAFNGERLLVHCEQGYGDVLQFCRYLPMVKALGGSIVFEVHAPLKPLFEGMTTIDELLCFDAARPPAVRHHQHIPLLSLPLVFGTRLSTIPSHIPYLHAPAEKHAVWGRRIAATGLRVGLIWSGSAVDPLRDCPLSAFQPLLELPGIHFYSLQKGPAAEQLQSRELPIEPLGDHLADFGETAAALAHLDLVICVDTAVAHLAGAMGKPVWLLLPFSADWRWLRDRDDSPWYPTVRLFRQPRPGQWPAVLSAVTEALRRLTASEARDTSGSAEPDGAARDLYASGLALSDSGDFKAALKAFQQVIALSPQWAEAHFNLGRTYHEMGRLPEAIAAYGDARRLAPDLSAACHNLGLAYQQSGELEAAARSYQEVIRSHPELAAALCNLGVIREQQGNPAEAEECYRCALRIDPGHADAFFNLGNIYLSRVDLESAAGLYLKALDQRPDHAKACANLGWTYHRMGLLEKALAFLDKAIALNADYPEAHLNRAVTRLLVGDWEPGWIDYEWRFQCHDWRRSYPHRLYGERWDGRPFKGKVLLVHSEQGIGDALLFARYLPMVKALGGRVIFEVRASLLNLFRTLTGVDELIELSAEHPPARHYHLHIPLCSLARIFNTLPASVPNQVPYLAADPARTSAWRQRLPSEGLNVGLVWGGNDTYKERSIGLAELSPLAFVKGINWIGLQKGPAAAQNVADRLPRNFSITNWGEEFQDFSDTAAAVSCLDLIISIDTSVAHLAGALNMPVWVLLPLVPDWRWMLERSQTPWYPSMRLFRQTRSEGWAHAVNHLCSALERWRKNSPGR